jgi:hypothetical protein
MNDNYQITAIKTGKVTVTIYRTITMLLHTVKKKGKGAFQLRLMGQCIRQQMVCEVHVMRMIIVKTGDHPSNTVTSYCWEISEPQIIIKTMLGLTVERLMKL